MSEVETLEGAGITTEEFHHRTDLLQNAIIENCQAEDHGGVVVCALVNTLSSEVYNMCTANGIDATEAVDRIRADILANIEELKKEFSEIVDVLNS